jgi:hypothetical protein
VTGTAPRPGLGIAPLPAIRACATVPVQIVAADTIYD